MGDRVSIQFEGSNSWDKSAVLFSHWEGMDFVKRAKKFVKDIQKEALTEGSMYSLYRLEAQTMMVEFIRRITGEEPVTSGLYLACSQSEGDNSDNGHHIINTSTARSSKGRPDVGNLFCNTGCGFETEHKVTDRDDDNIAMKVSCSNCGTERETHFRDCLDEDTRDWLLGK